MKKILLFIATFMFCIGVNAAIDFDNLKLEYDWNTKFLALKEQKNVRIQFKSNDTDFNNINSKDNLLTYGDVYYILNNGTEQKATLENYNQFYLNVESILPTTNEIELEIYFKTKDGKKSKSAKSEFLITNSLTSGGKIYEDKTTGIKFKITGNEPYNSSFSAKEVTDTTILSKIKYANPSAYEVSFKAYDKSYTYYDEKYELSGVTMSVEIPVPSKYNYQYDKYNLYGYIINKNDIKAQETKTNHSTSSENWNFAITEDEYAFDSYFVFSPSKEWVEEQEPVVPVPTPETPEESKYYCKKVDDKYYDKSGNVVDEAAYKTSCTETLPENPHTGIAIPFVALFTILGSILLLKKYKNKNGLRKI